MAEAKTKPTNEDVTEFLERVAEGERRSDCVTLVDLMRDATGDEPKMWGSSIIGFGNHRDWPVVGFSPRKNELTLYIMSGFDKYQPLLAKLGKHKTGKSCLYVKKLRDVDMAVLRELVNESVKQIKKK